MQRRVEVHDVARRPVRHPAEDIFPRSVCLAQADERAARVVLTPPSEANSVAVLVKHRKRLVRCPMLAIVGGNNQGLELERQKEIGLAVLEHFENPC